MEAAEPPPEPDCEAATELALSDDGAIEDADDEEAFDDPATPDEGRLPYDAAGAGGRAPGGRMTKAEFLKPGDGWGGSVHPARRALRIARANGLQVTSRKRSWGATTSDHNRAQRSSYALDLSNGSSPTREMDRTAYEIAAILGHPRWRGGFLNERSGAVRMQLIWRAEGHWNHVHVGVRVD